MARPEYTQTEVQNYLQRAGLHNWAVRLDGKKIFVSPPDGVFTFSQLKALVTALGNCDARVMAEEGLPEIQMLFREASEETHAPPCMFCFRALDRCNCIGY